MKPIQQSMAAMPTLAQNSTARAFIRRLNDLPRGLDPAKNDLEYLELYVSIIKDTISDISREYLNRLIEDQEVFRPQLQRIQNYITATAPVLKELESIPGQFTKQEYPF